MKSSLPRRIIRKIYKGVLGPSLMAKEKRESQKIRYWEHEGIKIKINAGVFHPGLFKSTLLLKNVLSNLQLEGKTILELGCGTGFLSVWVATKGAKATASDISQNAVECAKENANANHVSVECIPSDLFGSLAERKWDIIVINPPYYRGAPKGIEEKAWLAGEEWEYFKNLFEQLSADQKYREQCFIVLSEDCDIEKIHSLGKNFQWKFIMMEKSIQGAEIVWALS